ncbi:hypothetical protein VB715_02145 [Crocosphaera sp. UHCC 0190]|uniref:PilW family protein n=1 Tax=Crocosphaera sp. UHCC 0190 TaxID=3110246 RepID=UPI002B21B795|nr:hypothetical protein [Crocosphaera sp. UHCC 0190]MEA5508557.1 hypothetical protein [Crocosphaera sp. UHCC 0190]
MKKLLNTLIRNCSASGFTLMELLVAASLTLVVVSAAGYGMVVITRENRIAIAANDTQYNVNRAADFITEEMKAASAVRTDVSSGLPTDFAPTGTYQVILAIDTPSLAQPIIYYLKSPPDSPLLGTNAIYRWGPTLQANGSYGTTWNHEPLIDLIPDAPQNTNCATSGMTKIPSTNPKGFFVCVSDDQKNAELHISTSAVNTIKGNTGNIFGTTPNTNGRYYDKATYEVVTQAYTRGSAFTLFQGVITPNIPATATIQELAKNSGCTLSSASGYQTTASGAVTAWTPSSTQVTIPSSGALTSANSLKLVMAGTCGGAFNIASDAGTGVTVAQNGTPLSSLTTFTNNSTINLALSPYKNTTQIQLPSNKAIFFFANGTTPINAVLVTIN